MAIPFKKIKSKLGLDDTLPFGRHQGYTVEEILKDRPQYIAWLMTNTSLKFYPSVHELLDTQNVQKLFNTLIRKEVYMYPDIGLDDIFDDIPF